MRVLVVQNFDNTGPGQIETAFREAGVQVDLVQAHHGQALPRSIDGHDALIVLGGGQNALADADYPYFPALLGLMRAFVDADRAVLGVCLGSQLLARAYGAENHVGMAREFGWHAIALTAEGTNDPLFCEVPATFPIFQWHDDTFTLPAGATRLASSAGTANQAFKLGRAAYGIQFHVEADRDLVRRWNRDSAGYLEVHHPGWLSRFETEAEKHGPTADAAGLAIARAWVRMI